MALRIIRKDGDPVLRKKSKVVVKFDEKLSLLAEDMLETMYEADGVGLAAPQIGILKRIVVVDIYDETGPKVLVNPEIVSKAGLQKDVEGCLSVPGKSGYVERPDYVLLRAQDLEGNFFEIEGNELLARAFCHEIDHLNGVLFTDLVTEEDEL